MRTRTQRGIWALPGLSGQHVFGALALLTALGFGAAAVPALVAPLATRPAPEDEARIEPVSAGPSAVPEPGSSSRAGVPQPLEDSLVPRAGNHPPVVRQAGFRSGRVTALADLRLVIDAWDPDGDPIALRTTWWIDGRAQDTQSPVLTRDRFSRGDRLRASVVAMDDSHAGAPYSTREIVVGNAPPIITTFPTGFDATGTFVYPIGVVDADGDRQLEFHLLDGPDGMRIEAHEGTLTWRPRADQAGRHAVRVEVRDGHGGSESQGFSLRVRGAPSVPADLAGR